MKSHTQCCSLNVRENKSNTAKQKQKKNKQITIDIQVFSWPSVAEKKSAKNVIHIPIHCWQTIVHALFFVDSVAIFLYFEVCKSCNITVLFVDKLFESRILTNSNDSSIKCSIFRWVRIIHSFNAKQSELRIEHKLVYLLVRCFSFFFAGILIR